MENCIFCKIISGIIKSEFLYEDENMVIIRDISPQTKIHLLMIPKTHYENVSALTDENALILGKCIKKIGEISESLGLKNGFRLCMNTGADACQSVYHLHVHIIGGDVLSGRMG